VAGVLAFGLDPYPTNIFFLPGYGSVIARNFLGSFFATSSGS